MRDEKGQFVKGSTGFIGKHSAETKEKLRQNNLLHPRRYWLGKKRESMTGVNNWNWKDVPGYVSLHMWVNRHKEKKLICEICKTKTAKRYEWANISGEYKRELNDWMEICTSCHRIHDRLGYKSWETRRRQYKNSDL